jgi:hypothetical protein
MKSIARISWPTILLVIVIQFAFFGCLLDALAEIENANAWTGDSGDWSAVDYWGSNPNLPGPGDDVVINSPGSIVVTHSAGNESIHGLYVDNSLTISGGSVSVSDSVYLSYFGADASISLTNGTLAANVESVGWNGNGSFVQAGGSNLVTSSLCVGVNNGSEGLYRLTKGYLSANEIVIGSAGGSGTFEQTQGLNNAQRAIYLGGPTDAFSNGTYVLTNGLLNAAEGKIFIGRLGQGAFAMNGGALLADEIVLNPATGTFSSAAGNSGYMLVNKLTGFGNDFAFSGSLALGYSGGSGLGSYALASGQALTVSHELTVGYNAPCVFAQTGGTNSVSERMYLARSPGSEATYQLSGSGQLSAQDVAIGAQGHGVFMQSGGSHQIAASLRIGEYAGGLGSYELTGGNLSADSVAIGFAGGRGTFNQSGGRHSVAHNLFLGAQSDPASSGEYFVSGGTLDVQNGTIHIGQAGQGTLVLNGGDVLAGALVLSSEGTFDWTEGDMAVPASSPIINDGVINILGGDHAVARIVGAGTTRVVSGTFEAESIFQDVLTVGGGDMGIAPMSVPEPSGIVLFGLGIGGVSVYARRRFARLSARHET